MRAVSKLGVAIAAGPSGMLIAGCGASVAPGQHDAVGDQVELIRSCSSERAQSPVALLVRSSQPSAN